MPWPIRFGPPPKIMTLGRSRGPRLVGACVAAVKVRRARFEFRGAGIDHVKDAVDTEGLAEVSICILLIFQLLGTEHAQDLADRAVSDPALFHPSSSSGTERPWLFS